MRQKDRHQASDRSEDSDFSGEDPPEVRSTGPKSGADGDFRIATGRPRSDESRNVGARNHKHDRTECNCGGANRVDESIELRGNDASPGGHHRKAQRRPLPGDKSGADRRNRRVSFG
jgi:hypothetical protein